MNNIKDTSVLSSTKSFVLAAVAIFFVFSAVIGLYLLTPQQQYDFRLHQKIGTSSPLRLTFPEQMDHGSVEKYLSVPSDITYAKKWENDSLVLSPTEKLEMGRVFVVRVDGRAMKLDGTQMGRDLEFTFTVSGAPVVSARIPTPDATDVGVQNEIVIVFDRPIIPLSELQGEGSKARVSLPISISPDVRGKWRWLGTTTLALEPETSLQEATKYTVTVPAGIRTISDDSTVTDFSWSFETERPKVLSSEPAGGMNAGPSTVITFTLNQEADLISVKDAIFFAEVSSSKEIPMEIKTVKYGQSEDENGVLKTDKYKVVAVPAKQLDFGKQYKAMLKAGAKGLRGGLGTSSDYSVTFSTVGPFQVVSARYLDGQIQMDFSSPVSDQKISSILTFDPPLQLSSEETISTYETNEYSKPANRFTLWTNFAPSTKYTMTIAKNTKDIFGQTLSEPYTLAFETPALKPSVFLHPQWKSFSIFEKGKPPVFYLNDLNVSTVSFEFGKLSFEKFLNVRKEKISAQGMEPYMDVKSIVDGYKQLEVPSKAKKNEWESQPIDLEKEFGALKPGIYMLSAKAPEWRYEYPDRAGVEERFFAITNMAMTLKYSGSRALVWVTDLENGEPISGASIRFHTVAGSVPLSGKTNAEGLFEGDLPLSVFKTREYDWQPEFWVTAEKNGDFAFIGSDWNGGIQPYDFGDGIYSDFRGPESTKYRSQITLYTERPLYGAGDTVYFKGIARIIDEKGAMILPDESRSVRITVNDPSGKVIYEKTLSITEFGSFSDQLPIAKEAELGSYSLQATIIPDADIEGGAWTSFNVLAYRKPEYKAEVMLEKEDYFHGDTVDATIQGLYYFGAPMAGAKVSWRLATSNYYFNKYTKEWYSFALEDAWCFRNCSPGSEIITSGNGELDAAGRLKVQQKVDLSTKPVSQVMTLEADLTDQNNQVVSTRSSFIAHKSHVYVGIRSDEYVVPANSDAKVQLLTVDEFGKPVANRTIAISLYSRTWNTIREKGVDGEYYYSSEPEDTFIRSYSAKTDENGKAVSSVRLPDGGQYRVVAAVKDDQGLEAKAGWSLYAWADTYFNWPRSNNDRIEVVADKPSYDVGDTAHLLVKTPYQGKGVKALVTVEREQVMKKFIVDVTSNAMPIDIAITEDAVPAAYVSVVVMKPRIGETFNENGLDTGAPAMKIGYAKLPVSTDTKKITIDIRTDKEKYLPGEKVKVTLSAKDYGGKPVVTDISLGVVDLSLLDLAGFSLPDLVSSMYIDRGLGVQTSSMLLFLMERFKPGSKGGGGDGSADTTRGNFKDTAYWNPHILTKKDGTATVEFTLPDNLTTWQLLAIGSTKDSLFGSFAKNIIETKKVIIRSVRPRFAVTGDEMILGAIVHNYQETDADFTVSLNAKGVLLKGEKTKKVRIPKDGSMKVPFSVVAEQTGSIVMHFTAQSENAKDDIVERIPVYPFGVLQTDATSGVTTDQVTEKVLVPSKDTAPTGSLTVGVSPSLAVFLPDSLSFLESFPYGCTEQILSSFVPNIALVQLQAFEQFSSVPKNKLNENVVAGLQKLYRNQRYDGGFGYFQDSSQSYPYLTAYVLESLKIAKAAGYAVDVSVTEKAKSYIQSALAGRASVTLDSSSRAYLLYVLSEYGIHDQASLAALLKNRDELTIFAQAYIAMAYKNAGNTSKSSDALSGVMNTIRVEATSAHFEEGGRGSYQSMNSDATTTAIVLKALARIRPEDPLIPKIIQGMLDARHDGYWNTTQATAQVILSFVEYLRVTDELSYDQQIGVEIGGASVLTKHLQSPKLERSEVVKALSDLKRSMETEVKIGTKGKGKLYYDVSLSYFFTPEEIEPLEQGMGILRQTKPLTPADAAMKVGSTQKVTLTMTVPETRHFVAVESMLPAGFEPIDLQYATSQKTLLEGQDSSQQDWFDYYRNQTWRFSQVEYRDDRVFLFAEELPAGVYKYEYLVRATTPGKFKQRPAKIWEMYSPETFGQTDGGWLKISE